MRPQQLREGALGSVPGVANPFCDPADLTGLPAFEPSAGEEPERKELPFELVCDLSVILPLQFPRAREANATANAYIWVASPHRVQALRQHIRPRCQLLHVSPLCQGQQPRQLCGVELDMDGGREAARDV